MKKIRNKQKNISINKQNDKLNKINNKVAIRQ